jgi:hypothetical protein
MVAVGCQSDDKKSGDTMKMSGDACSHCAGVQKATADGKCPMCGKKVDATSMKSGDATAASASADACDHCEGIQTVTAAGKCSACGAEVAKK